MTTRSRPTTSRRTRRGGGRLRASWAPSLAGLVVLAAALVGGLSGVGTAPAASYRYWTYWTWTGTHWQFASAGPAFRSPDDGTVDGWRFEVSSVSGSTPPRTSPDFGTACGTGSSPADAKRVAVYVDYGTSADAPGGQTPPAPAYGCAHLHHPQDTGAQALSAAGFAIRWSSSGLVCTIGGYPTGDCAPVVGDPTPTPSSSHPSHSPGARPTGSGTAPGSTTTGTPSGTASTGATASGSHSSSPAPAASVTATASGPTAGPGSASPTSVSFVPAGPADPPAGSPAAVVTGVLMVGAIGTLAYTRSRRPR